MKNFILPLLLLLSSSLLAQPSFTGNANTDFLSCACFLGVDYADPVGDNGNVCGTVPQTGFDVDHVYMHYDPSTDILYVGMSMVGIAGDADGDGDPQTNTLCATVDCNGCGKPIQAQETIGINFDVDEDGLYDYFIGWPLGATQFRFYSYNTPSANPVPRINQMTPSSALTAVAYVTPPSASAPHPEFTMIGYSNIDPDASMAFSIYTDNPGGAPDIGGQTNINLPVELSTFDAQYDGQQIQLAWQTEQEVNNAGFEVQIAHEDMEFQKVDFVEGRGTINEASSYSFFVQNFQSGINYFRLKQIDLDGVYSYSKMVAVQINDTRLQINPNPVSDRLHLENQGLGLLNFQIINLSGQTIRKGTLNDGAHDINVNDLSPGIYLLKATGREGVWFKQFVKQ